MRFYLIGIKGNGMTSLAILLKQDGYEVEGEDVANYIQTEENLKKNNIKINDIGSYKNVIADIFIVGHSFETKVDNINNIVINYSNFLSFYLQNKGLVSICGSHGKTSMVGLLSHITNSSFLRGDGNSNYIENSEKFILESCEYKDHFLLYKPEEIILLNIDFDHSDYFKNYKQYLLSFKKFISKAKRSFVPYKLRRIFKNSITIGNSKNADFYYKNVVLNKDYLEFDIYCFKEFSTHIKTKLKGIQFIELITFGYAYCYINDLDFDANKLDTFDLAKRRFNIKKYGINYVIDDYAHHPSQINLHYKNICYLFKGFKRIAIFEPDRYSRLLTFKKDFIKVLSKFDEVYILPLPNMDENINKSNKIIKNKKFKFINSIDEIKMDKTQNTVYSFMSSKEMKENIEELHKLMEK